MKTKKILALIIALTMCISVFPTHIFAVSYNGVEFTALEGTGENGETENYEKLLDGKKTKSDPSKWCDKIGLISGKTYTPYIIFKASQQVIITDYNFITGNDNQSWLGRNPKDWVLYGCNDYNEANKTGGTWDPIHTVTDNTEMQNVNFTSYNFKIDDNDKMYQYYKLVILKNQLVNGTTRDTMQLGEMEINWTVANYVTFDKNGGDTEASPQIIQERHGLPTTNPTKTDHRFLGWYTKDGTDGDWGEEFTAGSTVSEDTTVYAKWEQLYWVTFDLNGGTADSAINPIYHGDPLPTVIPTKADVKFGGWFTQNGAENGGDWGEQYTPDTVVTENITVYAKWNTVNITFDNNGGDTDANPSVISSGEPLPATNPTRNGYKFVGWYTTNGDDGVELIPFTQEMSDAATADMTVYAQWEITTITFNSNNGEVEEKPNQLFYGEMPGTEPTMAGFTFDGWYTKNGMSTGDWGEKYLDGAIISEDTTVYAKWKATDKDCLANVTLTALSGTAGASGESYDKLVDGKKIAGNFSKWCVTSFKGAEVILKASAYTIPVGYTLTTGNDNKDWPGRNPKDWVLYGCNDYDENKKTGTWTVLDTVTNDTVMQDLNYKSYSFAIDNTKAYKYLKFEISSVQSGNVMQLGEFEIKGEGCEHTFGASETTEPTCTVDGGTSYICLKCGVPVINKIEATGHNIGENGMCLVCGEVCGTKVGDAYYTTLQEAVDAALASSTDKTVKLLQDFDITETITVGSGQVTLDLNGHTINMTGSGSVIKLTDSGSNFILDDRSDEKTGVITNSSTDTEYGGGIYIDKGKMTMKGGTIKACTAKYGGGIYKRSGELLIAGGTITECKADGNFRSRGGGIFNNSGKLEIAGGTISKCAANGWDSYPEYAGGGGIFNFYGNIVMSGGTITECTASGGIHSTGGGIKSYSSSSEVKMNGGTISNCGARSGGGIYSCESKIIIKGGTITDCYARISDGGGIYITAYAAADIEGGIISGNSASENGGGIGNCGVLNITGGEIKNNTASGNGGGIYAILSSSTNKGIVTMSGGTISGNKAYGGGGICLNNSATGTISGGTISGNTSNGSESGGGILIDNASTLNFTGGTISGNAGYNGGGISLYSESKLNMSDPAIVKENRAQLYGGGIQLAYSSTLTMTGGTVESNTAWGSGYYTGGGGIMFDNSTGTISDALIKGNNATNFGGGIHAYNNSNVTVNDTQITENSTYGGGGVSAQDNSTVTLNGGKIFKNNSKQGCGIRIDVAVANLNNGVEISENGSADGMYNDLEIYGAGIWTSESTINFNDANVINNHGYNGGGVYTYDDVVYLNLCNGNITGNTAVAEAGGICCKTNEITIKGAIQITGNKLISGTTQIENNVYLRNNTTLMVENPSSEIASDDGVTVKYAQIGVTVEDGYSNVVAANETDYSNCIIPDSEKDRVYYDESDKIVKIVGTYTVTFDMGDDVYYEETVDRNTTVSEPKETPYREGYYFGGWYIGDTPYDFTQPISGDLTLTAKWLEEGKFGMSITPSKIYIVTDRANTTAYGAAYKDGALTDITMQDIEDYAVIELITIDLDMINADTISLLVWDENQAPLCGKISFNIGG